MKHPIDMVIVAAGSGRRFHSSVPKALVQINGVPMLAHALRHIALWPALGRVVVVAPQSHMEEVRAICSDFYFCIPPVAGGERRYDSVRNGLEVLKPLFGRVAIHDAARPVVPLELLDRLEEASREAPVTVPGIEVTDTVKEIGEDNVVLGTLERKGLRRIQTPQIFHADVLDKFPVDANPCDEALLAEEMGVAVLVVEGSYKTMKVTYPEDIDIVSRWL